MTACLHEGTAPGIKVFWFFFSKKNTSSFVLRKRSKKTFISRAVPTWSQSCAA
jgi:hypothetical protein